MNPTRKPHRNGDDDDYKDDDEMDLLKIVEMRIRGDVRVSNAAEPSTPTACELVPAEDPGKAARSLGDDAAPSVRQGHVPKIGAKGTVQEETEWTENSMYMYRNDDMNSLALAVPSDHDGLECNHNPPPPRLRIPTLRRQPLVRPQTNPGAFAVAGSVGDDEDSDGDYDDVPVGVNDELSGREVVACVVYEDNDDQEFNTLPQAEPMLLHKARKYWNRKLCVFLSLEAMCAIVIVTVLLLALLVGQETKHTLRGEVRSTELQHGVSIITEPTGQAGTTLRDALNLPEYTRKAMENPRSPQSKAYGWLSTNFHSSKSNNRIPGWRLVQKFTLAVFYYATRGDHWVQNHGWLDWKIDECNWEQEPYGETQDDPSLHCDANGRLRSLSFWRANNLDGTIPPEIALLSDGLETFDFNKNFQLRGTLPTELGLLRELKSLRIPHGSFSGVVPTELGLIESLNELFLGGGGLEGQLPSEIGNLGNLSSLGVVDLLAHFPTELFTLSNLEHLIVDNRMSFTTKVHMPIPSKLGKLTKLSTLGLVSSILTGTIPEELSRMTNLHVLKLNVNLLSGTLPQSWSLLTDLWYLEISLNHIGGKLESHVFSQLTKLKILRLNDNQITGPIPTEIGLIANLREIQLHNTHISGRLPKELLLLKNLTRLIVSNTSLSGSIPDELCGIIVAPQEQKCFGDGPCYPVGMENISACYGTSLCGCSCGPCLSM